VRASGDYSAIVGQEKTLAFNLSGHVLHSIFWNNLSPDGGDKPTGELAAAIDENFGSFDQFKDHLSQATVTVQCSGWGSLAWDTLGGRLYIEQIYDHQGNVGQSGSPLLVLDAWEHAYYLQYLNVRADYVKAMWNIVNWEDVADRLEKARRQRPRRLIRSPARSGDGGSFLRAPSSSGEPARCGSGRPAASDRRSG
jgi:Fe-Mn family superoxide dismutase